MRERRAKQLQRRPLREKETVSEKENRKQKNVKETGERVSGSDAMLPFSMAC